MPKYIIAYDLKGKPSEFYAALNTKLEAMGATAELESVWTLETAETTEDVAFIGRQLERLIRKDDDLIVAEITGAPHKPIKTSDLLKHNPVNE